jgi:hypothetical protein
MAAATQAKSKMPAVQKAVRTTNVAMLFISFSSDC